jgi:tetratricopeptide (TPR) repeat protein
MTSTGKLTTKVIAILIILAILNAVGLSPVVLIFFMGVSVVVWLVIRRAEMREVERIFEFYVAADAILREEDRRWYGFEIAEVIDNGESLLALMPDPPPLNYFALGALYQRLGNHDATAQYLSRLTDDEHYDETHRVAPSSQLRRYVMMLRRIESYPATDPQTLAAIRSLERARQRNAGKMLLESRKELETAAALAPSAENPVVQPNPDPFPASAPLSSISAPPPISTVLRDVYQEETGANN